MNTFEKKLKRRIDEQVPDLSAVTPGVVVGAWRAGRLKGVVRLGKTYTYYDLASLTKILFTASACMHHFSENRSRIRRPISEILEDWKLKATPFSLLTHTAGLEWWLPMYQKLKGPVDPESRWRQLEAHLAKLKAKRRKKAVYSDPDLWVMGAYLSRATRMSLHDLWLKTADRIGVQDLFFHPGNKPLNRKELYAPTEKCDWRGRTLQGEVHDENCWAFGGVSSHAGLFGTLEGVADWGLALRKAYRGDSKKFGDPDLVRYFTGRRIPREIGDWGLGFMKPSRPRSSCGRRFSLRSFGHTGFTGTSFWFDPKEDLMVIILSNRVHPTRENNAFVSLRPRIHDWVRESLEN